MLVPTAACTCMYTILEGFKIQEEQGCPGVRGLGHPRARPPAGFSGRHSQQVGRLGLADAKRSSGVRGSLAQGRLRGGSGPVQHCPGPRTEAGLGKSTIQTKHSNNKTGCRAGNLGIQSSHQLVILIAQPTINTMPVAATVQTAHTQFQAHGSVLACLTCHRHKHNSSIQLLRCEEATRSVRYPRAQRQHFINPNVNAA